jgi:hypothetical protein
MARGHTEKGVALLSISSKSVSFVGARDEDQCSGGEPDLKTQALFPVVDGGAPFAPIVA